MIKGVGTPHCFIFPHEKFVVESVLVDQFYLDFIVIVGKAAEFSVFAIDGIVLIGLAVFGFVPQKMVELFNLVVGKGTLVPMFAFRVIGTFIAGIFIQMRWSSLIIVVVIVKTVL